MTHPSLKPFRERLYTRCQSRRTRSTGCCDAFIRRSYSSLTRLEIWTGCVAGERRRCGIRYPPQPSQSRTPLVRRCMISRRVWAIACVWGIAEIERAAAMQTLHLDVAPSGLRIPELQRFAATLLHRLQEFHHACGRGVTEIFRDVIGSDPDSGDPFVERNDPWGEKPGFVWWRPDGHADGCGTFDATPGDRYSDIKPAPWFTEHMDAVANALRVHPTHEAIVEVVEAPLRNIRATIRECDFCKKHALEDLRDLAFLVKKRVEESNSQEYEKYLRDCAGHRRLVE
ncbi:hypothetical protein C8R46DRAFT_523499 [Mycena filopes]|nr:hypothetical protein C8R46DRAFT_523499 [Mycena filopes]